MTAEQPMRRLDAAEPGFDAAFAALLAYEAGHDAEVEATVRGVLDDVRRRGDAALLEYTARFDGWQPASGAALTLGPEQLEAARERLAPEEREALWAAAARIRAYHEHQNQPDWHMTDAEGNELGQRVLPLDRAGLYVPGGKAAYPSTVLMNAIPAKVAGVETLVMVMPTPGGEANDYALAAAAEAGVDLVFALGGAQAVGALAYGTETVPRVDKIVGPGNLYVATAKRLVFGQVGIDMIAGPSEVVVVTDGSLDPEWAAYDLFSQAEHDEDAQAILISTDAAYLDEVAERVAALLPGMERAAVIGASLRERGALIHAESLDRAVELVNRAAPEHLELAVADPEALLPRIRHAGAIFLGRYTPEVLGDYCAGPNHVLPTAGTARFASPLSVYDFQKRSSVLRCSAEGSARLAGSAAVLARTEGLTAHARAADARRKG